MTTDANASLAKVSAWKRPIVRLGRTRAGGWYFLNVARHIDPFLLRATGGRLHLSLGAAPVLLLKMRGAKTGKPRSLPLVYAPDGRNILLVASKAGATKNPAWYHNLKAHPEISVLAGKRSGNYRAREAEPGAERERLWDMVTTIYPGYDTYQTRTGGRTIPVMVLEPAA